MKPAGYVITEQHTEATLLIIILHYSVSYCLFVFGSFVVVGFFGSFVFLFLFFFTHILVFLHLMCNNHINSYKLKFRYNIH